MDSQLERNDIEPFSTLKKRKLSMILEYPCEYMKLKGPLMDDYNTEMKQIELSTIITLFNMESVNVTDNPQKKQQQCSEN